MAYHPLHRAGACVCACALVVGRGRGGGGGGGTCFVSPLAVAGGQAPTAQVRASYFLRMNACTQRRSLTGGPVAESFPNTGAATFRNRAHRPKSNPEGRV